MFGKFLHLHHFPPQIIDCTHFAPITGYRADAVPKVANLIKDHARWNHNTCALSTTHAVINPIDRCTVPRQISWDYSIAMCMAMLHSKLSLRHIFSFQHFNLCIFHKWFSNFVILQSVIYWYQNVGENTIFLYQCYQATIIF